ncbi:MAG: hypothetical protein HUK19_06490 [Fibrobacter sp.]|nr:hypothetical protein [Fibrobacter sp.]
MGKRSWTITIMAALYAVAIPTQAQTKVACIGNSITEGYGLNWNDTKYPENLQQMLGDQYKVQNFGNSGKMFHKNSDESYWKQQTFTSAYDFAPDIVVIELGTNDSKYFFDGKGSTSGFNYYAFDVKGYTRESLVAELKKDYEALIDTFAHQPQGPRIYATLQPYAQNLDWFITDTAIVNVINPIIQEVSEKKSVRLIDLHAKFNKLEWLLSDNVHPNATGARELAKIIANAIQGSDAPAETSSSAAIPTSSSTAIPTSSSAAIPTSSSTASPTESSSSINQTEKTNPSSSPVTAKIFTKGNAIFVENYVGNVSVFDLNGNLVKKAYSNGFLHIQQPTSGKYIVKTK